MEGDGNKIIDVGIIKALELRVGRIDGKSYAASMKFFGSAEGIGSGIITPADIVHYNTRSRWVGSAWDASASSFPNFIAPDHSWRLMGFYGTHDKTAITRIGVIWGRF